MAKTQGLQPLTLGEAIHHVTAKVPTAHPDDSAGEVLSRMRGQVYETASDVAVVVDGRLEAIVGIEELLAAAPEAAIGDLGDHDPPVVGPVTPGEVAAWKAVRHGEGSLAVVGDEGQFLGMIPPHRLLAVLLWEHDEDTARFGGLLRGTTAARSASEAPVLQRFWHRIPWLLLGLAGSLLSVDIVRAFESEIRKEVSLAFFMPGVVYLADAVGTQAEALAIRGLPLGVTIRHIFLRELLTGLLVGIALAGTFFPLALWRWGGADVALSVAIALFAACSIATMVALLLPWGLQKLGLDPAFGSGPLATVIQDLLSIVVYFGVAVALVN